MKNSNTELLCALMAGAMALSTLSVRAASGNWNTDNSGNWSTAANWTSDPTVPGTAAGDVVSLTNNITAARTITLDTAATVGRLNIGDSVTAFFPFTLSGSSLLTFDNSGAGAILMQTNTTATDTNSVPIRFADNLFLTNYSSLLLSGNIDDQSLGKSITKAGTGTLTLSGANTYSGGTTLSAGTIIAGNNSALGTGPLTMQGGILKCSLNNANITNNIVATSSGGTITTAGNNYTVSGTLSGSGNLTFGGSGSGSAASAQIQLATNNMTSGTITMASGTGTPRLKNTASSSSAVDWIFQSGSTEVSGTFNFGSFGGSGNFNAFNGNSGTTIYNIGGNNHDATYSAVLSANGTGQTLSLVKVGTGAQTFSGASTYSGGTTLSAGQLNINYGGSSSANSAIGTGALTISGGTIDNTSAADVTLQPNNAQNWNGDFTYAGSVHNLNLGTGAVTLGATHQVTVSANTLTVGGIISGASLGLTKAGAGTLKLGGVNSYTGATTVNGGTLEVATAGTGIASGSAVAVNSPGKLLVDSGATVASSSVTISGGTLGGAGTISGNTTINSSGVLTPRQTGSATTTTFGGNLTLSSASANFTVSTIGNGASNDKVNYGSSGTLTLDNTDTINISCTTLDTANDYTLFTSTGGTVSMTTTPTLKTNGVTVTPGIGTYVITNVGSSVLLRYVQVSTPPTVNSASASPTSLGHLQTTTVTVNVTPQPGKSIASVTVTLDQLGGAGDPTTLTGPGGSGAGNWTGTFTVPVTLAAGSYTISGTVNQSDTATAAWSVSGITVTNASPTWSGGGANNKWSTGGNWNVGHGPGLGDTVAFAGSTQLTNNLDASVSVVSLTFNSGAGSFDITNAASTLTLSSGLTNNSANAQTLEVPVALSGAQTISAAAGNVTINGTVSDSGAGFTLAGSGKLTLSATNTFTGPTTISSGLLAITGSGSLGSGTYSAVITNNGALNYGSSASQTLSGIISGTGSVTNSGSGTLTLNGANTFSGGVTLNSGTLIYGNATALGSGTATLAGGTLKNGNVNIANNISVSGSTTLDLAGNNSTWSGNISGSAALSLTNSGSAATLSLSGTNSGYGGTITFNNNNAVDFKSANAGSTNAAWVFNDSTAGRVRIDVGNNTINFGSIAGSGQFVNNTASSTSILSVGALNTTTTFGGTIKDNGTGILALTKVGTGTLSLTGANAYTGTTIVSNGTLNVSSLKVGTGDFTLIDGTTVGINLTTNGASLHMTSLTLGNNCTNTFTGTNSTTVPAIADSGALTLSGRVVMNILGTNFAVAQYPLISYGSISGTGGFAVGSLPAGVTANIITNAGAIVLNVTQIQVVTPPSITNSVSGNTLSLTWPAGQGYRLVSQTNNLSVGLNINPSAWGTVPGYTDGSYTITIDHTKPTVFYRLVNP